jgi:hypothetical protein
VDETTSFYPIHAVSFKRKWRQKRVRVQISPQFLICLIKSSIAINSLNIVDNIIKRSSISYFTRYHLYDLKVFKYSKNEIEYSYTRLWRFNNTY